MEREQLTQTRAILQHELDYRRGRRSSIFTWASSILVALTGGVIGIQLQSGQSLSFAQRLVLSGAVIVLAAYGSVWWEAQRRLGSALRRELERVDDALGVHLPVDRGGIPHRVGGLYTIGLLALIALGAIWVPAA